MRVVLFSDDYEQAVSFFRDGLGLPVVARPVVGARDSTTFAAGPARIEVVREERGGGSGLVLRLEVDDLAPYPDSLAACGLRALGPVSLPSGERLCGVGGPGGFLVDIVEAADPPQPSAPEPVTDLVVVACVDIAPDPLEVLGVGPGAAHVLTTPGGVVTSETIDDLLAARGRFGIGRVAVVQHSPCCFTTPGPLPVAWPASPEERLRASLGRLLRAPLHLASDAVVGVLCVDGASPRRVHPS
jgi:catechol 2,3-dioxygenase-like lactoylglutathione lyase family enzyme